MDTSSFTGIVIEDSKIIEYLLNISHPEGSSKALFLIRHGFNTERPEVLKATLLIHLEENSPVNVKKTKFGAKYILSGKVKAPDGNELMLRSIWMKPSKENILKFVTAYPIEL